MKKILLLILIFISINLYAEKPKYIILLIGDGMGFAHSSLMSTINGVNSSLEQFPIIGISKTQSASDYVTDSGAGGTAIACGIKTYNGAIGVAQDSSKAESMLEYASKKGYATGIISTSRINHATPASFTAHCTNRDDYTSIANMQIDSPTDLMIGGGEKYFKTSKQKMEEKGFEYKSLNEYTGADYFKDLSTKFKKICVFVADEDAPQANKSRGDMLPNATNYALNFLKGSGKSFFVMVEGSQIDWAAHKNDKDYLVAELRDFNKTIAVALDFAKKNPNTLLIVTADHETGGLALENIDLQNNKEHICLDWSTIEHTGSWVPVFAFGSGAEIFSGVYENTEIFKKIIKMMEY